MTGKEKILYWLLLLYFCTLFYAEVDALNGVLVGLLAVYSFFFFSPLKEKWKVLRSRNTILFMLGFFLVIVVSLAMSDNKGRGFRYLDTRLPLFYFPVSIGLLQLRSAFKEKVLLSLAGLTTVVCALLLGWGVYRAFHLDRPELLYNDSLTEIIGPQSIYVALLVTVSIFIVAQQLFFRQLAGQKKALLLAALVVLFVASYFLASRNMTVVLLAATAVFLFYYILKRKKYLEGVTLLMALGIGVFLVLKFYPQTLNRFRELAYTKFEWSSTAKESHYNMELTSEQWNGANFRIAAWQCGWAVFKKAPFLGVGLGDKGDELNKEYTQRGFSFALLTKKNVHNNYLDVLMATGIIGLLLFLLGWIFWPLRAAAANGDWLSVLIIATIALALVTEVYFDRTLGGMIVGFMVPFLGTDRAKSER